MKYNELKVGALLSYLTIIIGNIISILYTPIMLRLLGQSEFGLYSLAISVVGYLGILNFGLGNAIVRFNAKYISLDDKEGQYNLNGMFIIVYSLLALLVVIAGSILVLNIGTLFSMTLNVAEMEKTKLLLTLMVFNLAISFPFSIFGSIINAYERFVFPKTIELVKSILNPLIMLPLLLMGYKSVTMTIVATVFNILSIVINIIYCYNKLKIKIWFKRFDLPLIREILGYSFYVFLAMIVDKVFWGTDQIILGSVSGTAAVAVYAVGSQFSTYYMSFSTAISGVFFPRVISMVTQNASNEELSDLFLRTGRIQYVIMAFILSGFILFGRSFVNIWAGQNYDDAYFIACIFLIPLTVPLIQTIGLSILQARNMQKFRSIVYMIIAVLNVLVSIPMAKIFGGIGCALTSAVAFFLGNIIVMNIYYYKRIKIDIPTFWANIFKMSIPVIIAFIIGCGLNKLIYVENLFTLLIKGIFFSIIYFILMWFYAINKYEKELFSLPVVKFLSKIKI